MRHIYFTVSVLWKIVGGCEPWPWRTVFASNLCGFMYILLYFYPLSVVVCRLSGVGVDCRSVVSVSDGCLLLGHWVSVVECWQEIAAGVSCQVLVVDCLYRLSHRLYYKVEFFLLLYSTVHHLPPLRFHCVGGCWDWTQDCCDFGRWLSDTLVARTQPRPC